MGAIAHLVGLRQFRLVVPALDAKAKPAGYWRYAGLSVSASLTVVATTLVVYFLDGT